MRSKQIPFSQKVVKKEFTAIFHRQPDIGGMKNNLLMGLYLAAYFKAAYQVNPANMTGSTYEALVSAVCNSDIFRKMCEDREFFTEKNMETRKRLSADPEFNSYEAQLCLEQYGYLSCCFFRSFCSSFDREKSRIFSLRSVSMTV